MATRDTCNLMVSRVHASDVRELWLSCKGEEKLIKLDAEISKLLQVRRTTVHSKAGTKYEWCGVVQS
jgi:hypothetical protein